MINFILEQHANKAHSSLGEFSRWEKRKERRIPMDSFSRFLSLSLFLNTTLKVVQLNLEKMVMITQNPLKILKSEENNDRDARE